MSVEWQALPNLRAVSNAQHGEWEIEGRRPGQHFLPWEGEMWRSQDEYHGRPKQPKTKTVKLLGWITDFGCLALYKDGLPMPNGWLRVPAEDKTVEVEV